MAEEPTAIYSTHADPPRYSFWVGVAFTINYVIGSGFLTIPWAFQQTGPLLGLLVLFVFAFFSVVSVLFILETMERAELLYLSGKEEELRSIKKEEQEQSWVSSTFRSLSYRSLPDSSTHNESGHLTTEGGGKTVYNTMTTWVRGGAPIEKTKKLASVAEERGIAAEIDVGGDEGSLDVDGSSDPGGSPRRTDPDGDGTVNDISTPPVNRRIEIIEMCDLFLGPSSHYLFTFCVILYLYGTCWCFCTVFANAFGAHLYLGPLSYMIYLFVFFVLVTPFSLMELSEQICVQVTLAFLRVVMVLIMIVTTMAAYASRREDFGDLSNIGDQPMGEHILEFHFDKIYLLLPIAAYAYIFHHSVPALSEPITDKKSLGKLFAAAMMIAALSYSTLGLCVSLYFGQNTMSSSNLNWENFDVMQPDGSTPFYAQFISFFVVLFPALDVASAYPLNAFTLGNCLLSTYYGSEVAHHSGSRTEERLFRLLAAVPPFIGAMFVSDLSHITGCTGLAGFLIAFIFPPLLSRYSAQKLERLGLEMHTKYSSVLTSPLVQMVVCGSGCALLVVVTLCMLLFGHPAAA